MKLLFSAFPDGLAGFALLLFRGSLAFFLVAMAPAAFSSFFWSGLLLGAVAFAVMIGFLTRILAGLCAMAAAVALLNPDWAPPMPFVTQMIDATALAMIGPGAMSVDSWMFGRRTFHLPA